MVFEYLKGNIYKAKDMQLEKLELIKALFCEVNPIPVKYALNKLGFDFGLPRLPLIELSKENKEKIEKLI